MMRYMTRTASMGTDEDDEGPGEGEEESDDGTDLGEEDEEDSPGARQQRRQQQQQQQGSGLKQGRRPRLYSVGSTDSW
jgi:hypothetical protein